MLGRTWFLSCLLSFITCDHRNHACPRTMCCLSSSCLILPNPTAHFHWNKTAMPCSISYRISFMLRLHFRTKYSILCHPIAHQLCNGNNRVHLCKVPYHRDVKVAWHPRASMTLYCTACRMMPLCLAGSLPGSQGKGDQTMLLPSLDSSAGDMTFAVHPIFVCCGTKEDKKPWYKRARFFPDRKMVF